MIKLRPRTTYRSRAGNLVHIAGPCQAKAYLENGSPVTPWWSIGGNWYDQVGRFLRCIPHRGNDGDLTSFTYYTSEGYDDNLVEAVDTAEARQWWVGVDTDRRNR